jgi:hypothetical protein
MSGDSRILFVHVPKSAGMSVFNGLAKAIGSKRSLRFVDGSEANKEKYLAMTDEEVRNFHLLSGHFALPFFLKKPVQDYKIITVVRKPIDRELSAYFYMKTWEKHPRHAQIKKMDLYHYLEQRERKGVKNPQCWHVCGTASFEKARDAIDERYFMVASLEQLLDFCRILEKRLNLAPVVPMHDNRTSFRLTAEEIHPALLKRFEALTQGDLKLYHYVKEKFEKELREKI